MKIPRFFFIFIFELIILNLIASVYGHGKEDSKVLLISFDGFRHDYFELAEQAGIDLKNFKRAFKMGFRADYFENVFIPRTFPNHISIITGCYEETHGIIDNVFFDPYFNETYSSRNLSQSFLSKWLSDCEPIWVTNMNNGYQSAVLYWPGQLAPYKNKTFPSHSFGIFNKNVDFEYKVDIMISWLLHERTNLGLLYHPEPDRTGHLYGPKSSNILEMLIQLDKSIGYLLEKIKSAKLESKLNVLLVSDHGMTEISNDKRVIMDNYIDPKSYGHYQNSLTLWGIWPKVGINKSEIIANLSKVPNVVVYKKQEIPLEWHYANSRRVAPIIVLANEGWVLVNNENETISGNGSHGYSMLSRDMRGIFVAWGPQIVVSNRSDIAIRVVDVFPLIGKILQLHQLPSNNGSLSNVRWLINEEMNNNGVFISLIIISSLSLLTVLSACIIITCAHYNANALRVQKIGNTYVLKSGNLVRKWQQKQESLNGEKSIPGSKYKKFLNKKSKITEADAAFLLESNDEDEILGDIPSGSYKFNS